MKVEIIEPHGLCAGVNAAIAKALRLRDVYCLHSLVHNEIVVDELKALGYRFVEDIDEVPAGETVVFSAHGVPPSVRESARARKLKVVDLTCPYVARAHKVARTAAEKGREVIVLGDRNHVEVKGILGEIQPPQPLTPLTPLAPLTPLTPLKPLSLVCQTTLNLDEAKQEAERIAAERGLKVAGIEVSWPCNATKERQDAVRGFARRRETGADRSRAVLVLGSRKSANTKRLVEVAELAGAKAYMASSVAEVEKVRDELAEAEASLPAGRELVLGVTSGASTPERFFMEAVKILRNVPRHVAIIMDGNGRWATRRGKNRGQGHIAGAKTLTQVLRWCGDRGIDYLTVYAFSTENWKRPKAEVDGLMALFAKMLKSKEKEFIREQVRFRMIGRRGDLSASLQKVVANLEEKTKAFPRQFLVAISYGGRAEIVDAVNAAIARGERVTEETFSSFMYAPDVPDPDLVIRTSGELRTSNFLLWESAYSEYYFTDVLWPDFTEEELDRALSAYAERNRRKGGV